MDQAGLLGKQDDLRRRHHTAPGVLPARQRLEADDLAAFEQHLQSIVDREFITLDGLMQRQYDFPAYIILCTKRIEPLASANLRYLEAHKTFREKVEIIE